MPGSITVHLTDRECDALAELSRMTDLPQERVMIQALRAYQASLCPVPDFPKGSPGDDACDTCGCGYYLPSGRCDHCNSVRTASA